MATIPVVHNPAEEKEWRLPSRGLAAMVSLIIGETALFSIFVVAYVFYMGKSISGPQPSQVLELPIFMTICLWSSSLTIVLAERAIEHGKMKVFSLFWGLTILLGAIFLGGTAMEWHKLIYHDGLTISTNLFGTTFYSLVGLHASHVIVGLIMLLIVFFFSLTGRLQPKHAYQIKTLALYWHFVDAVWVVVFTVVYLVGR
ncbi:MULTISPECIES: cytochrome c oxidase subunit 3 [Acidobacterium]|uniref:cytochrome c oxidase subunit 3 n=1 Tax=Acidobacterium TaxID=33973 RepID=UPI0002EAB303|nr:MULTISPECIES: cytochrome c oxidase subunit 3 [Acidobacterium]HCT62459.1 heme-copper oxidase subunit III [Acidobacterium sp.]